MEYKTALSMIRLFFLVVFLFSSPSPSAAAKNEVYIIAVVPSAPPVTIHALWAPFLERLSRESRLDFRLKVYNKMSEFERDISKGTPDFIFANPLQAVVAHEEQGYVPLVRGSRLVSAAVFVRKDSPIRTVDDLAGKKIAMIGNKNL